MSTSSFCSPPLPPLPSLPPGKNIRTTPFPGAHTEDDKTRQLGPVAAELLAHVVTVLEDDFSREAYGKVYIQVLCTILEASTVLRLRCAGRWCHKSVKASRWNGIRLVLTFDGMAFFICFPIFPPPFPAQSLYLSASSTKKAQIFRGTG